MEQVIETKKVVNRDAPATQPQIALLDKLEARGLIQVTWDPETISRGEASDLIDESFKEARKEASQIVTESAYTEEQLQELPIVKAGPVIERSQPFTAKDAEKVKASIKKPVNYIRLGMAMKLVYSRDGFSVSNKEGVAKFKKGVQRLYEVLEELEVEMAH